MTGAGPETEQAELFPQAPARGSLDPRSNYFDGYDAEELTYNSVTAYGIEDDGTDPLHRFSYLYSVEYPVSDKRGQEWESEVGRIELRGRTWAYHSQLPQSYRTMVKEAAHRAAMLFNTSAQRADYDGYLDGFNPIRAASAWEAEEVGAAAEGEPGTVDWNVEIYDEDGNLSGVAQGLAFPWKVSTEYQPGRESIDVTPHQWNISYNDARGDYQIAAEGRTSARERYRPNGAAHHKTVVVNGKTVGSLDEKGRTWIKPEYQVGDGKEYRGYWSREGLVQETAATYQAIRKDGNLYMVGEDDSTIYLRTAAALPDGFKAADSDDVSPTLVTQQGRPATERHILDIQQEDDPLPVECRRDERVIRHLGYSTPNYRHAFTTGWWI